MILAYLLSCVSPCLPSACAVGVTASSPAEPAAATPAVILGASQEVGSPAQKVQKESPPRAEYPLGLPLVVYGTPIPDREIKRFLAWSVGHKEADARKFSIVVQQELARRKEAGEDIAKFEVTTEQLDKALEKQKVDFLLKYPTLDFPTEVGRAFLSLDLYRQQLRQTMIFDRLFLPDDPEEWPATTTEAIINATGGTDFVQDAKDSYKTRKQMQVDQNLPELPPDDPIFTDSLRAWLLEALNSFAVTESNPERLPEGVLMTVDGAPVKIDEIFQPIAAHVTRDLVDDARRFLAQMAVVERHLSDKAYKVKVDGEPKGDGTPAQAKETEEPVLISRGEFEKTWVPGSSFQDALAQYEMLAVTVQGFPSTDAYVTYTRLERSYRRLIADELKDDAVLRSYLERANHIAGAARCESEIILCSAYDYPHVRWFPNGWADAEKKANSLKKQLDEGADWNQILDLHSDFWDPPMPEIGQKPQFGFRFKGRFGKQTRNQLLGDVDESDFTLLLDGTSVGDRVFFDQKLGTIAGPFKGRKGYYITRAISRTPPSSALNMANEKHRGFLIDIYVKDAFGTYSRELLNKAIQDGAVQGL
jgi:hypothetical protein